MKKVFNLNKFKRKTYLFLIKVECYCSTGYSTKRKKYQVFLFSAPSVKM